jgi:hypothetical protein
MDGKSLWAFRTPLAESIDAFSGPTADATNWAERLGTGL